MLPKLKGDAGGRRRSINELARKLYRANGYRASHGSDFGASTYPQEQNMFRLACIAYEHFLDDDDLDGDLDGDG